MWQIFCSKCTKYWEKLLLVFWQTRSATVTADVTEYVWHFWWCTEISPPDSRIPALPHYVDNAFTWREPHKHFEFLSVLVSITSGTVWKWKKKNFRGKNLWPHSDGCFSMIWGMPCTCFFLPLLILESSMWSAHSGAFYTPPESHRSLLSQDASGESDSMWILYFLMPWSWGMRAKDQTWLTLGCKSGCNSTEWDPALGGAPLERALSTYNLMDGLFSSIKGLTHHMTALNMVRQASSLMCLLHVSTL